MPAGRPPIKIDAETIEKLAALHATQAEIAGFLGISVPTLDRRLQKPKWRAAWERGKADYPIKLRQQQRLLAEQGNPTMLIWLGKQLLGQKDKLEHSGTGPAGEIEVNVTTARQQLAARIASAASRINEN